MLLPETTRPRSRSSLIVSSSQQSTSSLNLSAAAPEIPKVPEPSRIRRRSSSSNSTRSTSSLNLTATGPDGQSKRCYLFIFVILWFSSLQIVLFTWNQLPSPTAMMVLPSNMLPRRSASIGTYGKCSGNFVHVFRCTLSALNTI